MGSNDTHTPHHNGTSPSSYSSPRSFEPSWGLASFFLPIAATFLPQLGGGRRARSSAPSFQGQQAVGGFGSSFSSLLPYFSCWYLLKKIVLYPVRVMADQLFLTAYLQENTPAFSWVTLYLKDAGSTIHLSKELGVEIVADANAEPDPSKIRPSFSGMGASQVRRVLKSQARDRAADMVVSAARQHSYRITSHPSEHTLVWFEKYLLVVSLTRKTNYDLLASSLGAISSTNGNGGQPVQQTTDYFTGNTKYLKIRFIPFPSFLASLLPITVPSVPPPKPSQLDESLVLSASPPSVQRLPSRSILLHLVSSSKLHYATQSPTSLRVHTFAGCNAPNCNQPQCTRWSGVATRSKRSARSVVLPRGQTEWLKKDLQEFIANKAFYTERGIPHRRGVLLYGPPGSGKTSLVTAISSELQLDIYTLDLSSSSLTDARLQMALSLTPPNCIILIEDIDVAFAPRTSDHNPTASRALQSVNHGSSSSSRDAAPTSGLTMSGLLGALDGLGSVDGRILFTTTNYYSRLDPALTRPGRLDIHIRFDPTTTEQVEGLFVFFMLPTEKEVARRVEASSKENEAEVLKKVDLEKQEVLALSMEFGHLVPSGVFSAATIQGYLLDHKDSPREAVENASTWVETQQAIVESQREEAEREWEARLLSKAAEERKKQKEELALLARLERDDPLEDDLIFPSIPSPSAPPLGDRGAVRPLSPFSPLDLGPFFAVISSAGSAKPPIRRRSTTRSVLDSGGEEEKGDLVGMRERAVNM